MHVHIHMHADTHIHVRAYTSMHTYAHTHTHTHTHTYTGDAGTAGHNADAIRSVMMAMFASCGGRAALVAWWICCKSGSV